MGVQRAIFPGMIFGIFCLIGFTSLLTTKPGIGVARAQPEALQSSANLMTEQAAAPLSAAAGDCSISRSYPQSIQQWCGIIDRYARETGLDPNLVSAVMLQESAGKADAYSKSGAVGLMQVMPRDGKAAKFMCKNGPCFSDRPTSEALFDPEFNVSYGTNMLADLIRRKGSVREALRAYGPMDVGYYYADLVLNIMRTHQ